MPRGRPRESLSVFLNQYEKRGIRVVQGPEGAMVRCEYCCSYAPPFNAHGKDEKSCQVVKRSVLRHLRTRIHRDSEPAPPHAPVVPAQHPDPLMPLAKPEDGDSNSSSELFSGPRPPKVERVPSILSVAVVVKPGDTCLHVVVGGEGPVVPNTGLLLRRLYLNLPPDGIWEYDFFAQTNEAPDAPTLQVSAISTWETAKEGIKGVRVFGSNNVHEARVPLEER